MSLLAALVLALATAAPPLPNVTLDAAHGLLARGHDALAEAEYRSFLDEHPDHADQSMAWYGLGVALFQQAKHDEAIAALRHLEDDARFPYAAEVGTMLGRAHLAEGRPELALAALQSVVTRHGTHDLADDAGSAIVESHLAQGDHAAAIKAADEFATRWPQSALRGRTDELAARAEMQLGRDRAGAERLARLGEDTSPSRRLLLAQLWHRAGVTDRAADAYERVLDDKQAGSLAADASSGLARLLHDTGRFDDAIRQIDRHLRRFEGNAADLRILAARCRLEKGDATQAVRAFQELVKDDDVPGDEARYWLARSQLATGDAAAAERVLAEAVRRYPKSTLAPELKHDHAVALLRLARPDDALTVLATLKLPKKHRLTAPVALLQAQAQHHAGQYDGSAEGCRRLLASLDPASDTTLRTAATFLLIENEYLAGNLADAARGYTSFIETFPGAPERPQAELRLGLALVELGEADAARPWLIRSAKRPEGSAADAQLALADLAYAAARWDDARQAYDAFLERSGDADDVTAGARLRRALAARRLGDDRTASRELAALVKSGLAPPHRAAARYELGLLAQEAGDARNAHRHFDAVLADDGETPYASRAAFANAGLVAAAGDARAAADLYADAAQRATALGETSVADEAHFQQGQMLFAADAFADAAQAFAGVTSGPRTAEALARRAIALARANAAEATAALRAAEAREGLDPALRTAVLYELAWTYRNAGAEDDAIAAYERLLAQAKDDPRADHARIELADLALAADDPTRAASWLQPLLRKTESSVRPDALYRLGVAALRQGDHSAAASHLEEYVAQVKTGPLLPAARLLAGEALATLGAHGRAVEMLEPIRRIDDVDVDTLDAALVRLGESYAALQQWAKSEQRFATHLDQLPEATRWAHARFGRGWARENQGRSKDAIADYEVVVAGHQGPLAARAQFQIGECLFAEKDLAAAVRALLKVDILYAYPEWSAAALYEAGRCFEGLGDLVQARTQFTQVTERYGNTDWARLAEARLTELQDSGLPGR